MGRQGVLRKLPLSPAKGGLGMAAKKKAGKTAKATKSARPRREPSRAPRAIAVGDAVRLPAEIHNQISRYDPRLAGVGQGSEAIAGIVCSIRKVATGKLVAKTSGPLDNFVLEILHSQTFRPQLSSVRNSGGPKGSEDPTQNPTWRRLRAELQEMAGRKQLVSHASGRFTSEPFDAMLDGWRVVKVRAELVDRDE